MGSGHSGKFFPQYLHRFYGALLVTDEDVMNEADRQRMFFILLKNVCNYSGKRLCVSFFFRTFAEETQTN